MKQKFLTRICAALLGASVLVCNAGIAMAAGEVEQPTQDGYFWLEAETDYDSKAGTAASLSGELYSGNGALNFYSTGDAYAEYKINVTDAGSYKIYYLGGNEGDGWVSPAELIIDGETRPELVKYSTLGYTGGYKYSAAWMSADVTLSEGVHTIRYNLKGKRPSAGDDNKTSLLDLICIMPAHYTWTPSTSTRPVEPAAKTATDGYYWLEAETDTMSTDMDVYEKAELSGGEYLLVATQNERDAHADFYINVTEAGNYRVYFYGWSREYTSMVSNTTIKVNGSDVPHTYLEEAKRNPMQISDGKNNVTAVWHYADVQLNAGNNILSFNWTGICPAGYFVRAALDVVCIMPSGYEWTPSFTTRPKPPKAVALTNGYAWIEADTDFASSEFSPVSNDKFSGGTALIFSTQADVSKVVKFNVNAAVEGDYKIYYYGTMLANKWASASELKVNNVTAEVAQSAAYYKQDLSNVPYTWNETFIHLNAGTNAIEYKLNGIREGGTYTIGGLDAMYIIPADKNWITVPAAQAKTDVELEHILDNVNRAAVDADITLPATTPSGISISWSTNNAAVITDAGVITRGAEDASATLTAIAGETTKTFAVNVKKITEFDVISFTKSGTPAAGQTVSASAAIKCNDGEKYVLLIVAAYDVSGKMISADIDRQLVSGENVTLNASLTAPADTVSAKAFLWKDLDSLAPIIESL